MKAKTKTPLQIENRKARFNYHFLETYTAGLALTGPEVKAIRAGHVSVVDAYCTFSQGELWTHSLAITVDGFCRPTKLLLKRKELDRLSSQLQPGKTIIITKLFAREGRIKAEVVLAQGKRQWDKRETLKKKDAEREAQQATADRRV